jgi:branched-chain amino acid transport system substrate-binding protein
VVGYTTGLVVQQALAGTGSMAQLDLRRVVYALSGELRTLDGTFALGDMGEQVGEVTPIGYLVPDGESRLALKIDYPGNVADARPVFPP